MSENKNEEHDYFSDLLDEVETSDQKESKKTSKNRGKKTSKNVKENTLDSILAADDNTKKDYKSTYKGIYFDEDIYKVLTDLMTKQRNENRKRRNIQSQLVNDCLREVFESRGLL